jgi:hypothetical protein
VWQRELPILLESVYRPSGRTTGGAIGRMLAAAPAGAVLGWLAGALVLFLTCGACFLMFELMSWMAGLTGRFLVIIPVFITLLDLAGIIIAFILAGALVAIVVAEAGKSGQNRNVFIPAALSALAAAPVMLTLCLWMGWLVRPYLPCIVLVAETVEIDDALRMGDSEIVLYLLLLTSISGVVAAAVVGRSQVHEARYCEECQESYSPGRSVFLHLSRGADLAAILDARNFESLREYSAECCPTPAAFRERLTHEYGAALAITPSLHPVLNYQAGEHCKLTLHTCPQCGQGYLEAEAHAEEPAAGPKKAKTEKKWKFRSVYLSPAEAKLVAEILLPQAAQAQDGQPA